MAKSSNVPEIRFAGFTDPWEQRKLGEVLDFLKDGTHGTHKDAKEGPFLLSAKNIKNGQIQWGETDRRISWEDYDSIHSAFELKHGDVLLTIVGSIGETAVLDNPSGITFQRSVAYLRPCNNLRSDYLYAATQSSFFQRELADRKSTSAQPGIYLGDLANIPIAKPRSIVEQSEIGSFASTLDNLITLHQRKYDKLVAFKKAMLEKMFPKEGETVPEIRFAGFTDPWEQRKFSELYKPVSEKNDLSFGRDKIISVANMYFNQNACVSDDEYLRTYNIMRLGDIAFEGHANKEFSYGRFVENYIGDGIVSHIFVVFRPQVPHDVSYWRYAINNEKLMKQALVRSTKASTMMHDLVSSDLLNERIPVPCLSEQEKIGSFLESLDSLITLHQRKLEVLNNLKKAMLDKMFV